MLHSGQTVTNSQELPTIATEVQHPSAVTTNNRGTVTRRNFIVWWLATLLTGTVVAAVAPLLVFIYPPAGNTKRVQLKVTLKKGIGELQPGEATQFDAPSGSAFVMIDSYSGSDNAAGDPAFSGYLVKDTSGKTSVFAVNCSHLGCSVAFNATAKRFDCPCHGSQFNLSGGVVHGPATAPLSNLKWSQGGGDTQITIDGINLPGL